MEDIKEMGQKLGLYINKYGYVCDRFVAAFEKQLDKTMGFLGNSKEFKAVERRSEMIWSGQQQVYLEILKKLAEIDDRFNRVLRIALLNKKRGEFSYISHRNMERIGLTIWRRLGNEIPVVNLDLERVKKALKNHGYVYIRDKLESGWYFGPDYIGKSWQEAFVHMESFFNMRDRREEFI